MEWLLVGQSIIVTGIMVLFLMCGVQILNMGRIIHYRKIKEGYKPKNRFEELCLEYGIWGVEGNGEKFTHIYALVWDTTRAERVIYYSPRVLRLPEWIQRVIIIHEKAHIEQDWWTVTFYAESHAEFIVLEYFKKNYGDINGSKLYNIFWLFIADNGLEFLEIQKLVMGDYKDLLIKVDKMYTPKSIPKKSKVPESKPLFKIADNVRVKPNAESIYGDVSGNNIVITGIDTTREALKGKKGVVVDREYASPYDDDTGKRWPITGWDYRVQFDTEKIVKMSEEHLEGVKA